jgi:hypothetical protein
MSKNFFNFHRYRRTWGKKIERAKHDLHGAAAIPRDTTWRSERKRNPFAQEDPHAQIKHRVACIIILISLGMVAGLFLFHPFFFVSIISITGNERLKQADIEEAVRATMAYKKWYFLPARSYFLVNVHEIRDVLVSRFPLSTVEVKKVFPHHVQVQLSEKISTIIYDTGKKFSYIGLDGKIVEVLRAVGEDEWKKEIRMVSTTLENGNVEVIEEVVSATHIVRPSSLKKEFGQYPIVYDRRERNEDININTAMLEADSVRGIIAWFHYLTTYTDVVFAHLELDQEFGDAVIYTEEGWQLRVRLSGNLDEQFEALHIVLTKQANPRQLRYIDVRYPGKVYWQ